MKFQKINLNKIILFIFKIFILVQETTQSAEVIRSCKISDIQLFGHKTFCESATGSSISCIQSSDKVRKVYLSCDVGYYNEEGISQQILYCTEKGRWSEIPIKCEPECVTTPETIELIKLNELKFPTAYIEFVRITPVEGKPNVFPGILISERKVLTKAKYFKNNDPADFTVLNYKSTDPPLDNDTYFTNQRYDNNYESQNEELSILFLPFDQFIKYDNYTKPICKNITSIPEFHTSRISSDDKSEKLRENCTLCTVPHIDNTKFDITCFKYNKRYDDDDINKEHEIFDCSKVKLVPSVKVRCQIGYINNKENDFFDNNIKFCHLNRWLLFGEENDCQEICGLVNPKDQIEIDSSTYIDTNIDIVSAPWHAGIYAPDDEDLTKKYEHMCGGSIIHSNIVISAAHCVYYFSSMYNGNKNSVKYLVGAGKRYHSRDIIEKFEQYAEVDKIHIPPHYKPHSVENDISILVLDHHLTFTSHVKPICIDWKSYEDYNFNGDIIGQFFGWGVNSIDGIKRNELRGITLKVLPNNQCKRRVGSKFRSEITGDRFCAVNDYNVTACQGDSGGGFVIRNTLGDDTRYILKGVFSIGVDSTKFCSAKSVTVFTNLQYYQDIIKYFVARTRDKDFDKYLKF